jgi:nucleoside-diphosphate-sugar epimerase
MLLRAGTTGFEVFNVGAGTPVTVKKCAELALRSARFSPGRTKYTGSRAAQAGRLLDCAKAKRMLGWEPVVSIVEGIGMTTEWWKTNKGWWKR